MSNCTKWLCPSPAVYFIQLRHGLTTFCCGPVYLPAATEFLVLTGRVTTRSLVVVFAIIYVRVNAGAI